MATFSASASDGLSGVQTAYEKLGLGVLRRLWVNVDLVWSAALIVTGMVTPFV